MGSAVQRDRCERRVHALVHAIGLPDPWHINEFLDRLETYRGRPIDLCAMDWTHGSSSGAWRTYHDHDVVAYASNTSSFHQDAIILHEVGHMLAEHQGQCVLSEAEAHRRAPDLLPAALGHLLERVAAKGEEHEAETTAILILSEVARQHRPQRARHPLAAQVEAVFG